ncbi:hypothetical protein F5Y19DRAFT_477230 [Xylariaceae sp. FL1651]|nr:hypothetical protein F5Y19DRAFT_477230 [Xylariaceae sp. FL1651]
METPLTSYPMLDQGTTAKTATYVCMPCGQYRVQSLPCSVGFNVEKSRSPGYLKLDELLRIIDYVEFQRQTKDEPKVADFSANQVKSFWLGWGSLCAAGAGAYYFAKKSINADRAQRFEETQRKKRMVDSLEYSNNVPTKPMSASAMGGSASPAAPSSNDTPVRDDFAGSPSQEASNDPAPTRHAPATEGQRVFEKSKYESSTPFQSPKGDRFS